MLRLRRQQPTMPSETCGPTKFKVVYLAFSAIRT